MNSIIEEKIDLLVKKQGEIQEEIVNLIGILQNPKDTAKAVFGEDKVKCIDDAIETFREKMEARQQYHFDTTYPDMKWKSKIILKKGSKFMKLFDNSTLSKNGTSGGIKAFVNLNNGQIYKPASYKIPAKHARGNVFADDNGVSSMDERGSIRYLKG